jgi:hypothetical protein
VRNELRLPTSALEWHDRKPGDRRRHFGAEIAANKVNAEVEARGSARGRQHAAIVDVEDVRIDLDAGMTAGEIGGRKPVRRSAEPVEHASCRQHKRAAAD